MNAVGDQRNDSFGREPAILDGSHRGPVNDPFVGNHGKAMEDLASLAVVKVPAPGDPVKPGPSCIPVEVG